MVKRDIDIIKKIHNNNKHFIVSFSFSSTNDYISSIFEPGVPSPTERLETIKLFKKEGITCGMFLMPVIPFITDKINIIDKTIKNGKDAGIDFVVFGGMTLKEGRQRNYFYKTLDKYYPDLITEYYNIYQKNQWGNANDEYYKKINFIINNIAKKYKIPTRISPHIFKGILNENDLVIVILEHIDYLLRLEGKKSPYGYAAYSISKLKENLSEMNGKLRQIKGVGATTEIIIKEILDTGSSKHYKKLLFGSN